MKKESKSTKDTGHSFADYFKRALNPLLVLLLLSEQPMYVYEMMREISKRSDGRYTISLLYPVIQRLLSQGYVCEGQKAISDDNRVPPVLRNHFRWDIVFATDRGRLC